MSKYDLGSDGFGIEDLHDDWRRRDMNGASEYRNITNEIVRAMQGCPGNPESEIAFLIEQMTPIIEQFAPRIAALHNAKPGPCGHPIRFLDDRPGDAPLCLACAYGQGGESIDVLQQELARLRTRLAVLEGGA